MRHFSPLHPLCHDLMLETDRINKIQLKTLVLVHPGSLFGSADYNVGHCVAEKRRDIIRNQLLTHLGQLIVIDGFLSDEIDEEFNDAIFTGLSNACQTARYYELLNPASALRVWGCDGGEHPFDEWESFGNNVVPLMFAGQEAAAEALCPYLETDEIEVTGAWATEHGRWGCVNSVAEVPRDSMPDTRVWISETALFDEHRSRTDTITPLFNLEQSNNKVRGSHGHS